MENFVGNTRQINLDTEKVRLDRARASSLYLRMGRMRRLAKVRLMYESPNYTLLSALLKRPV